MFVELTLPELSTNFYSIKYQQSPTMLAQEKKREEKEMDKERERKTKKEKNGQLIIPCWELVVLLPHVL